MTFFSPRQALPLALAFGALVSGCGGVTMADSDAGSAIGAGDAGSVTPTPPPVSSVAAAQRACVGPDGSRDMVADVEDFAHRFSAHRWFRCDGHPFSLTDDGIEFVLDQSPISINGWDMPYGGHYYLLGIDGSGNLVRKPGIEYSGQFGVYYSQVFGWTLRFSADVGFNDTYDIPPRFTTPDGHMVWANAGNDGVLNRYVPID